MRFVAGQGAVAELLTCRDAGADWQGRGRTADLHGTPAQTGRDVAESHREAAASGRRGRTADLHGTLAQTGRDVAESHREASGRAAVAELLLARAPWRNCCWQ